MSRTLRTAAYGLAATLALTVLGIVFAMFREPKFTVATTETGEQRRLTLPDGSQLSLNTATTLKFSIDDERRRVSFGQGEAFFEVAPDPTRPFVIEVGSREVRVVGTAFNVRRLRDQTEIAVTEGKVSLSREIGAFPALFPPSTSQSLTPGMLASYTTDTDVIVRSAVPIATVGSWRQRQLIYRGVPLADVVADLDRYFPGTYAVDDEIAALKVSAVIQLTDEAGVMDALANQLPLRITKQSDAVTSFSRE